MTRAVLLLFLLLTVVAVALLPAHRPAHATGNSILATDSAGDVGRYTSLALDAAGNPVISYFDASNGDLKLLHCNDPNCAGGDDSIVAVDTVGIVGAHTSLVLDAAGNPVVSYYDSDNADLKLLHCNDPNCAGGDESITSPDTEGDVGWYTSLALDASGNPVVSYQDVMSNDLKLLHCNDPNCAGGDESITSPDTVSNVSWEISLTLDAAGNPVVSYFDGTNGDLKLLHCNDSNCDGIGESITSPDTAGIVGVASSLVLDPAGNPIVSYRDVTNNDLKLLHCNDPNCSGGDESITTPATAGDVVLWTSLALDTAGNPVVGYWANTDLKILRCNDPNCSGGDESITSPDTTGNVGQYTSLALDAAGNPVVSYYDATNGDLKLLHCANPACSSDTDNDGCTDAQELGPDPTLGGQRNPKNFWDFFDTPDMSNVRDGAINLADVLRLLQRFASEGDPSIDPLSTPPPAPAYHPAFDRSFLGPDPWDLGPGNGAVSLPDVIVLLAQFGHLCA